VQPFTTRSSGILGRQAESERKKVVLRSGKMDDELVLLQFDFSPELQYTQSSMVEEQ